MKYSAILTIDAAMEAVKQDGYALRYVLNKELFVKISGALHISIEV